MCKKNYQVSVSFNDEILEITVKGEMSKETYENVTKEINAAVKASKATKAIVDFRAVDKRIDPSDIYRYVRIYDSVLFEIKYAVVDLPQNVQYRDAAIEAGLTTMMWFNDTDAARTWMKKTA